MPDFYKIKAKAAQGNVQASAEILIYAPIGDSWWEETVTAKQFIADLNALDAKDITVRINSVGGSVPDAIAILNALQRHPAKITTINDALAASAASFILMAGDTIEMADNAVLMVHGPWTYAAGNSTEMRKVADMLDTWAEAMASSYAKVTGKTKEETLAMLKDGEDHWYTAEEALAEGYIHNITSGLAIAASLNLDHQAISASIKKQFFKPADVNPSAASQAVNTTVAAATPISQENENMPQAQVTTAATANNTPATKTADEIRAEALQQDQARRNAITAEFKPFAAHEGMAAIEAACLNDTNCTVDAANKKILAQLAVGATPIQGRNVVTIEDGRDKIHAAITNSILARAAVGGVKAEAGNPYRGMKLLDLAKDSLARAHIDTRGMDQLKIVANAFTQGTSDFPILLENVMHKALQTAYAAAPDTWSRFCKIGSVGDFRAHSRYRVGSIASLDELNELGEFTNKTIPDGEKGSLTATTKGNIINLSRQAIINDDLGAFVGLAATFGRAGKRTIERDVYALFALNSGAGPTMEDGIALFHASHGNISGSAGAPSVTTIEADRVLMASQLDVGGNDYLDLRPTIWLGPIGLGGQARVANDSQFDPDANNKLQRANIVRGLFADVVDTPRLSSTPWYLLADPNDAPVFEVAFLDGNQEPYMEMENGFDVDGARWKVRLDFAVGATDYRGITKNAGA
jgi:ATP-dependent protease ClpP protease subunit